MHCRKPKNKRGKNEKIVNSIKRKHRNENQEVYESTDEQ